MLQARKSLKRSLSCNKAIKFIKEWCDDGISKVENNLKEVEGRQGYNEAEDFWNRLERTHLSDTKQMV